LKDVSDQTSKTVSDSFIHDATQIPSYIQFLVFVYDFVIALSDLASNKGSHHFTKCKLQGLTASETAQASLELTILLHWSTKFCD
jgi:hypothetical protein